MRIKLENRGKNRMGNSTRVKDGPVSGAGPVGIKQQKRNVWRKCKKGTKNTTDQPDRWAQKQATTEGNRLGKIINTQRARTGLKREKIRTHGIEVRRETIQIRQKLKSSKDGGKIRPVDSPFIGAECEPVGETQKKSRSGPERHINSGKVDIHISLQSANGQD